MSLNQIYGWPTPCTRCHDETCFFCENYLSSRHEHDHYPIPARAGGTETVAVCVNCHDLKDRMSVVQWPGSSATIAVQGLLTVLPLPRSVTTASGFDVALVQQLLLSAARLTPDLHTKLQWELLSIPARLMYAKLTAIAADDATRTGDVA